LLSKKKKNGKKKNICIGRRAQEGGKEKEEKTRSWSVIERRKADPLHRKKKISIRRRNFRDTKRKKNFRLAKGKSGEGKRER